MSVCSCKCLDKIPPSIVANVTNQYFSLCKSRESRCQFFLNYFTSFETLPGGKYILTIGTYRICVKAFCQAYQLPEATFYHYQKKHREGVQTFVHGLAGIEKENSRKIAILAFIDSFIAENGNFMPDVADKVYLPPGLTLKTLFDEFSQLRPDCKVSAKYFGKVYHENFQNVAINVKGRFTCKKCTQVKDLILSCRVGSVVQRNQYQLYMEKHLKIQRLQRQQYSKRTQDALQYPKSYLCLTTDGMDQKKTLIPYSPHPNLKTSYQVKVHVFGAWLFGRSLSFFLDIQEFPHDSNYHCTVIMQKLLLVKGEMPRHLHLQLDNTAGQNKNQIVFSFLAYLVETKVLDTVTVGFLMVGHTHQILDQVFSWVSRRIFSEPGGVLSFQQLVRVLCRCYTAEANPEMSVTSMIDITPDVSRVEKVYAIKQWLSVHMIGLADLHDSHQFLITADENGRATLRYKQWAESPEWLQGGPEFDQPIYLLHSLPQGYPDLVIPTYNEKLGEEEVSRIKLLERALEAGRQCGAFKETTVEEWEEFFEEETLKQQEWDAKDQWDEESGAAERKK